MSAPSTSERLRLRVAGIVQGVGFRPFVYQQAVSLGLSGFVFNDGGGVGIEIEGPPEALAAFERALNEHPPPLARIDGVRREAVPVRGDNGFVIRRSEAGSASAMVSPDVALCDACETELRDPENRRYRYPFINCTDCGPRYTIVEHLPYDRPNTSMEAFAMCPACEAEYNDPANRRYHAQPVSCYDCGPVLTLYAEGEKRESGNGEAVIDAAARRIREGEIVAVKGLGGFHLVCDATDETAVRTLRERKRRPSKPLAVMFPSMASVETAARLGEADRRLILSRERPVTVVTKREGSPVAPSVAPGIDRIGVFLPYTPLHLLLLEAVGRPVVATSANLSDEPIITDRETLERKLGHVVDAVLDHDRAILNACDDSVAAAAAGKRVPLRMARGYAPASRPLPFETGKKILAVGANQKNAVALAFGKQLVLSPHIGDLVGLDAFEYFERTLGTFRRFYDFSPDVIVCDLHPGYETTRWAEAAAKRPDAPALVRVQHHYAHVLACMAEHGMTQKVLAFAFDGTGYGGDGTLWGAEVLVADVHGFERVGHLRPFRLLGGEKAVREPRRVALAMLFECFSPEEVLTTESPAVRAFEASEIRTLHAMWSRGLNAPWSSSAGRLFDAAASLAGLAQTVGYEGESGLLVEAAAAGCRDAEPYAFPEKEGVADWEPMLRAMLAEKDPAVTAARFMATLAAWIVRTAKRHRGLPVVLTGGVFQNRTLLEAAVSALEAEGIDCLFQRETPLNDGGIALGQAWYALHNE